MTRSVLVYAKRTPIGKLCGGLSQIPAPKLTATLIHHLRETVPVAPAEIEGILLGNVLTAGVGQAPARQAAIYGGLPHSVPAITLNKVCGSGLQAVMLADQMIRAGDAHILLAGGQENMSLAPHLFLQSRTGVKFGAASMPDHMQLDGLWDPYHNQAMGNCGELCAKEFGFSRQEQDQFAIESYKAAQHAMESGWFAEEIVPVSVRHKNQETLLAQDEEPFSVDLARLPTLRAAFDKDGTVTAGNASSLNDGAALLLVMEEKEAERRGLTPLARIVGQATYAHDPLWFTTAPIHCIEKLLAKTKRKVSDVDLWEINEAFSVVGMAAMRQLEIARDALNCQGGAVALGHPIGASGARILVTLLHALQRKKQKVGVAAICIGGGEACSLMIERL